jgi:hypothetical protein
MPATRFFYSLDSGDSTPNEKRPYYTPDFQVWYKDKSIRYYEVKQEEFIDLKLELKFPILQNQAVKLGKKLDFVLDSEIRSEPYFSDVKTLYKAKKNRNVNDSLLRNISALLTKNKKISAFDLINKHNVIASTGYFYCFIGSKIQYHF